VPRQDEIVETQPADQADPSAETHRRGREALTAALPDIGKVSAELIGHGDVPRPRSRKVLAAVLGISPASLTQMDDADVSRAVGRLRALIDQCARLADQATVDELTGAMRRGSGMAALQREIDRNRRSPGKGLVAIFIDLDGLKAVNDRDGHAAGDERLRATVKAIRERLRSYDLVIRYGGDEFVCVLTNSDAAEAERTAAALRENVLVRAQGSISVGVAELQPDDDGEVLVARADLALYTGRSVRDGTASPAAP
jgi:diguanylate cyclase (GGDEF)-like protein